MTDAIDTTSTSPDAEGTPEEGSPEQQGTDYAALVASARKRQAGAEAARQAAESKLADAMKELGTYKTQAQSASEKELSELATLKAHLEQAELRAREAEAKAEARILDARFPNARKELPEITDEVKLAKFEAMLADPGEPEPPTPRGVNGPRSGQASPAKEVTSADILAKLATMTPDW
jgi:multidrug efflux pump subunit AcrA (membrane-fusion protein)